MSYALRTNAIACLAGPWSSVETDLVIVPWFEDESPSAVAGLDDATGGEIARALSSKEFQAKAFDIFLAPVVDRDWQARRIALIGAGRRTESASELIRKLAAAAALAARQRHVARVAFAVRGNGPLPELAQAAAEGLTLAEFDGGSYKTQEGARTAAPVCAILVDGAAAGAAV